MNNTDEINAKRDARRRRILENSERRLMKITGTSSRVDVAATDIEEKSYGKNIKPTLNCQTDISNHVHESTTNEVENLWYTPNKDFGEKVDRKENWPDHLGMPDIGEQCTSTLVQPTFLFHINQTCLVLLAAIVHVLLISRFDHSFAKTTSVPFFVTMVLGRLYASRDSREKQKGNLLFAALVLCNIRPESAHICNKLVTTVSLVVQDLALYIFSFTLMYYGLSSYVNRPNSFIATLK